MRPMDRTYSGANLVEDVPLYDLLYRLTEVNNDKHYRDEADKSIDWFKKNGQSKVTGLYAWGSHMYWDVHLHQPVYDSTGKPDGGYGTKKF